MRTFNTKLDNKLRSFRAMKVNWFCQGTGNLFINVESVIKVKKVKYPYCYRLIQSMHFIKLREHGRTFVLSRFNFLRRFITIRSPFFFMTCKTHPIILFSPQSSTDVMKNKLLRQSML